MQSIPSGQQENCMAPLASVHTLQKKKQKTKTTNKHKLKTRTFQTAVWSVSGTTHCDCLQNRALNLLHYVHWNSCQLQMFFASMIYCKFQNSTYQGTDNFIFLPETGSSYNIKKQSVQSQRTSVWQSIRG